MSRDSTSKPTDISIFDQSTGIQYNANTTYASVRHVPRASQRASMSYVTGTHAFKAGMQLEELVQRYRAPKSTAT